VVYWLIAAAPIIVMTVNKERFADCGFARSRIGTQIMTGVFLGIAMSVALTLVPHLLGFGTCVDNGKRYQYLWQFAYEFFYCITAIGFAEEFVFRGFVYEKIKRISQKDATAVIGSSVLFGVFHLFSGSAVQMLITACIGSFFCLCRLKIKNCSTLSLIVAHGIYDALITVWASALL
jgi:membrane protease YdiL (CAAX protease family)